MLSQSSMEAPINNNLFKYSEVSEYYALQSLLFHFHLMSCVRLHNGTIFEIFNRNTEMKFSFDNELPASD